MYIVKVLLLLCGINYIQASEKEAHATKDIYPTVGIKTGKASSASVKADFIEESRLDLEDLTNSIKAAEHEVQRQIRLRPHAVRVLVVGLTGSGKSTLVHALAGKRLLVRESELGDSWEVDVAPGQLIPGYEVGHGLGSATTTPCSWYDERSNLVYWDCPGFLDSRGPKQEIINAFAIDQLLRSPSRVKILLAMQEADFQNARGSGALDRIEKLIGIIPEIDQLKQSLIFVASRKSDAFPSQRKIKRLLNDVRAEKNGKQQNGENTEVLEKAMDLLSYLDSTTNTVFSFPAPTEEGEYPDSLFSDKDTIITSLQRNPVNNPSHSFAFETDVIMGILHMMQRCGNVGAVLTDLMKDMHLSYRDKNLETLQAWQLFVSHLITNLDNIISPVLLADELTRLPIVARTEERFISIIDRLQSTQRYVDFVKSLDCISLAEVNLPQMLEPSLRDMNNELQTLIEHKQFLVQQKERTEALAQEVEQERRSGKINKEQAERKIAELERQGRIDKENAERRIEDIRQEQERAQQKADTDLKKALTDIQTQHESQVSALKKQLDDMAKATAEAERVRVMQERMNAMTLSPGFGGTCGGFPMMDQMGAFPGFDGSYGGMGGQVMRSHGSSHRSHGHSISQNSHSGQIYVKPYTRSNGTQVSGYWRSASNKKR